jgi:hypothetical protein
VRGRPFIEAEKAAGHGVARACRLLKVSRAAYYQRRSGSPSSRAAADAVLAAKITEIHGESKGTYGAPRVHQALRRQDITCGKRRVARLMRAAGLEGRRRKRWRATTIADPAAGRARDLIQRDFAPRPGTDRRYAGDITYSARSAVMCGLAGRSALGVELASRGAAHNQRPSRNARSRSAGWNCAGSGLGSVNRRSAASLAARSASRF